MLTIAPNWKTPANDLITAATSGDLPLVERLIRTQFYDINEVNYESGWTPLMYAANYGNFNVARVLIHSGCDIEFRDPFKGLTALMLAASNGHTRCMQVLIKVGNARIDARDNDGHDALYYAITCGHGNNKMVKNLLENRGEVLEPLVRRKRAAPKKLAPIPRPTVDNYISLCPSSLAAADAIQPESDSPYFYESSLFASDSAQFWMPAGGASSSSSSSASSLFADSNPVMFNSDAAVDSLFAMNSLSMSHQLSNHWSTQSSDTRPNGNAGLRPILGRKFYS